MYHRNRIFAAALFGAGVGLILSCLFGSCAIRLILGIILGILALFVCHS